MCDPSWPHSDGISIYWARRSINTSQIRIRKRRCGCGYWNLDMRPPAWPASLQQSARLDLQPHEPWARHVGISPAPALVVRVSVHAEWHCVRCRAGNGGGWRSLLPRRTDLLDGLRMFRYYLGFPFAKLARRRWLHPVFNTKYNALQRAAYFSVPVAGLLSVATGWAIHKPMQLHWLAALFGGYNAARVWHFWLMWVYILFVVPHVILVFADGERKLRRFREGRHHAFGSLQKGRLEQVFRCWLLVAIPPLSQSTLLAMWEQAEGRRLKPTPPNDLGPFYKPQAPLAHRLSRPDDPGPAAVCIRYGIRCERRSSAGCQAGGVAGRSIRTL